MRKNLLITLVLCLSFLIAIPNEGFANIKELKQKIREQRARDFKLGQGQMGRKFIVAIPPNEMEGYGWDDSAIEVYIASANDVLLDLDILGTKKKKALKAGNVYIINSTEGLNYASAECRHPNTASTKTITIEATGPVSVYVMNSKNTTSDGYMALPVDSWQTEYMHCSYYDNYEGAASTQYATGFLVIASEDATKVICKLRGIGDKNIATLKNTNESIGDTKTFTIDAGEVYQVETDGLTRGEFDLSGTLVRATKPIGIISYHKRTEMPILSPPNSRDHLSAMPMPIATWGKEYASIALDRNGSTKGDMFRILALEDNTSCSVQWYDMNTKAPISSRSLIIHEGQFAEISDVMRADPTARSITGTSIFRADKPVFIMQYSYSSAWDGSTYDPFMWPITSVEQYITGTILQAPANKTFGENHLNIVAWDDPNDPDKKGLKSIEFDGTKIVDKMPAFINNRIPGTDLYWARFKIAPGLHKMSTDGVAKFGGYIYGFKSVDSYGWPAAMALRKLSETDTVPPAVSIEGECGEWTVHVTELTIDPNVNADPRQVDTEVWDEPATIIMDSTIKGHKYISYNISEPQYVNKNGQPQEWKYEPHDNYFFKLSVLDKFQDAKCYFYVADQEGNITIDSVEYFADSLTIVKPKSLVFGRCQIFQDHFLDVTFKNAGRGPLQVNTKELVDGEFFEIVEDWGDYDVTELAVGEEMELRLKYHPTEEIEDVEDFDLDSISFKAECLDFKWPITGQGVTPKIKVTEWISSKPAFPGNDIEKTVASGFDGDGLNGIIISNPGSDTLIVTKAMFETVIPEFRFTPRDKNNTPVTFPIEIQPRMFSKGEEWKVQIMGEYFTPSAVGRYQDNLVFSNNAFDPVAESDSISEWDLVSSQGTVTLTDCKFGMQHVGTKKDIDEDGNPSTVTVKNTGNEVVIVTELAFIDAVPSNDNFMFVDGAGNLVAKYNINPSDDYKGIELAEGETYTFNVVFVPFEEKEDIQARIFAKYYTKTDLDKKFQEDATGILTGHGTMPNVKVTEATFTKTAPGKALADAEVKQIEIINSDEFEVLEVRSISINPAYANDFIPVAIDGVPYANVTFPITVPTEGKVTVDYAFAPPLMTPNVGLDKVDPTNGFIKETDITVNSNHVPGTGGPSYQMVYEDFVQNSVNPEDEGFLRGYVVDGDATVEGIAYGMTMRCNSLTANVKLNNLSQSQNLIIDEIVITEDDNNVFVVTDAVKADLYGSTIPMGGNSLCEVLFDPTAVDKAMYEAAPGMTLNFSAKVAMKYHFVGSTEKETMTADLTASARLLNVDISQKIETRVGTELKAIPIQPGMFSYNTGGNVPHYTNYFFIEIANKDEWSDLEIKSLSITYKYKKEWMGLIKVDKPFALNATPGFEVVKSNTEEDGEYFLDTYTISTSGAAYLNYADARAAMLNPLFLLYLSGDTKYMPEITNVTFATRDECITYTSSTQEIPLVNCIQDINLISSTGGANLAPSLAPNPVVGETASIKYGVALNAPASLKIYNEKGEVVKVVFDSYQQAGSYEVNVSTKDLPSGAYIIRLEQNTFVGEGSMVITK